MMKILIVGAGATGGYFGTRLIQAGRDVTFLVRPHRAEQLRDGLRGCGPGYDLTVPVRAVTAGELDGPYDLILLMTKAWSLDQALEDIAPVVGPDTTILPLLNGMAHLERVNARFGRGAVLGGIVRVVATVTPEGAVFQFKPGATMIFGEQDRQHTDRAARVQQELSVPGYDLVLDEDVLAAMWHKWAFIVAGGTTTCLMRGTIGAILATPGGREFVLEVIAETERVAAAAGYPVSDAAHAASLEMFTEPGSVFTSSLYRDLTAGFRHEGEHLLGEFVATAERYGVEVPLTRLALAHVRVHDQAGSPRPQSVLAGTH
ncbi:ketopantoate reductase family protein [Micrococcus sp. TA1]|uniref:ketopantoate reductase family protein n=1 Tax=Micrococcus sp. TA1 TaxID=681627 RepID=UPI0018193C41|nr:ketopantoate reductase family protein [Micrococcus sp. TA1]MBB5749035.1 2-dehydropantoate 2-reductase [Micrococcus sp. TA1]